MQWLIVRTEFAKEQRVQAQAENHGYECYLPLETRCYRARTSRARQTKEVPVLPRLLLVQTPAAIQPLYFQNHLLSLKYIHSLLRDATGTILSIPDWQIELFRATVAQWRENAATAHAKPGKRKRPKLCSFEDLANFLNTLAKQDEIA